KEIPTSTEGNKNPYEKKQCSTKPIPEQRDLDFHNVKLYLQFTLRIITDPHFNRSASQFNRSISSIKLFIPLDSFHVHIQPRIIIPGLHNFETFPPHMTRTNLNLTGDYTFPI